MEQKHVFPHFYKPCYVKREKIKESEIVFSCGPHPCILNPMPSYVKMYRKGKERKRTLTTCLRKQNGK